MRRSVFIAVLIALAAVGCSPANQGSGSRDETTEKPPPEVSALSGVEEATRRAVEWEEDAELYAVAAIAPRVNAAGKAPGWLYTYVSRSAGAVGSVAVAGDEVRMEPEQPLPEPDIENLSRHALPPPNGLLNSTEAMAEADEVRETLDNDPEAQAAAGLDSLSGGEPIWIFSTVRGGERIEERVPASRGG